MPVAHTGVAAVAPAFGTQPAGSTALRHLCPDPPRSILLPTSLHSSLPGLHCPPALRMPHIHGMIPAATDEDMLSPLFSTVMHDIRASITSLDSMRPDHGRTVLYGALHRRQSLRGCTCCRYHTHTVSPNRFHNDFHYACSHLVRCSHHHPIQPCYTPGPERCGTCSVRGFHDPLIR